MELLTSFPNAEELGLALFESLAPTALVTPAELVPPLIVVRQVNGFDDRVTGMATLQVQTFAATYEQAWDLAERGRQLVLAAPATVVAGASIDRAITESAPVWVDYGQPSLHRFVGSYRLEFRRAS